MPNELDMDAYHQEGIDPGEHKVFNITPTIHSFNERFQGEPQGISNEDIINRTMGFLPHNEQMPLGWWRTDTPKHEGVDLDAYSDYQKLIARYPKPTKEDMSLFQDTELDFGPNDAARYQQPYDPDAEFAKDLMYKPISDKQVPFAPYTSKSIEDIATKHKVEAGQIKDILKDLNEHPENIVGTGELGAAISKSEIFNLLKSGKGYTEISKIAKTSPSYIYQLAKEAGIKLNPEDISNTLANRPQNLRRVFTDPQALQEFSKRVQEGATHRDLAKEFNLSSSVISDTLDRLGLKLQRKPGGQVNPNKQSKENKESYEVVKGGLEGGTRRKPGMPNLNLPEFENYSDPEYEKALSDWMKNQNVRDTKTEETLRKNPNLRQVPWPYSSKDVKALSHEDYMKWMENDFEGNPYNLKTEE